MADEATVVDYAQVDAGAGPQPAMPMDFPGLPGEPPLPATLPAAGADVLAEAGVGHRADAAPWDAPTPSAETVVEPPSRHGEQAARAPAETVAATAAEPVPRYAPAPTASLHQGNGVGREETVVLEGKTSAPEAPAAQSGGTAAVVADRDAIAPEAAASDAAAPAVEDKPAPAQAEEEPPRPARRGWWQRKLSGLS
jgi:hypothetical protein